MPTLASQLSLIKDLTLQAGELSLSDEPERSDTIIAERHQLIVTIGDSIRQRTENEQQEILTLFNWLHIFDQKILSRIKELRDQSTFNDEQQRIMLRKGQKALKSYSQTIKE